jgi:hypothetical protein
MLVVEKHGPSYSAEKGFHVANAAVESKADVAS